MKIGFFENLTRALFPVPRNSEDGGGGDDVSATIFASDEILAESEEEFIKQFAMRDEEYQDLEKQELEELGEEEGEEGKEKKREKENVRSTKDEDPDLEDDEEDGDGKDETDIEGAPETAEEGDLYFDEKGNKEYVWKDGKWQDRDQIDGVEQPEDQEDEEPEDVEYIDDVIPGLKGVDFAKLSRESKEAIATYFDESKKVRDKHAEIENVWEALSNDPIAKHRIKLIQSGQNLDPYQVPEISDADLNKILDSEKPEDAKKALANAVKKYGQVMADNTRIEIQRENAAKEINRKGESIIISAGNLHPECQHKIGSLENIGTPDSEDKTTYDNYTSKVIEYCQKRGWRYDKISEYTPEELYALVAIRNGWPIVQNAADRDRKMIKEKVTAALKHFTRSRSKEFASGMIQRPSDTDRFSDRKSVRKNGVDLIKLAQDDDYHDKVISMRPMDEKWLDKVTELRMEGEKILERRQQKKKRVG